MSFLRKSKREDSNHPTNLHGNSDLKTNSFGASPFVQPTVMTSGSRIQKKSGGDEYADGTLAKKAQDMGYPVKTLNTAADADYLSQYEKDVVLAINMARWNPKKFGEDFIKPQLSQFTDPENPLTREKVQTPYEADDGATVNVTVSQNTSEGKPQVQGAYDQLINTPSMPALQPNEALSNIAQKHSGAEKNPNNPHEGADGSTLGSRIKEGGIDAPGGSGENIDPFATGALESVIGLIIDDGNGPITGKPLEKQNGHRRAILNPEYKTVGVGSTEVEKTKTVSSGGKEYKNTRKGQYSVQNFHTAEEPITKK